MVTLKASYTVKPAKPTPTGHMYLSEFDQVTAITHAPTVYFYTPINDQLLSNPIEILKNSLSKTLTIFHPLTGRLRWTDDRGCLELDCNAMGALFLETKSESTINDFSDFTPSSETRALLPSVDYDKPISELPLLLVQVTKFSCGGISLGLGMSHVVVDGRSAAHFVAEWARIARGEEPENGKLPFLDRTILKLEKADVLSPPSRFEHLELGEPLILIGKSNNLEERKKATVATMLELSKEQIQKLENEANEYPKVDVGKPFTRYEVVAAHMWRCASKARQHENEQLTSIRVPTDFHSRILPPLPEGYFGNAVLPVTAIASSGDLLSKPLAYASSKIREAMDKVTDEYIRSSLANLKREEDLSRLRYFHIVGSTQGSFSGNPNMAITSWIGLPLFGVDFGWGKEIYMGPGIVGFDGKSFVFPGYNEDGSFAIPLQLQVAHMDAFKKFFYETSDVISHRKGYWIFDLSLDWWNLFGI